MNARTAFPAGIDTQGLGDASLMASGGSLLLGFIQLGTGAVARTAQSKLRDTVSVKDFGAVGDGITDDTAAIQAAITACYGKILLFPATATYLCGPLSIAGNIRFLGEPGSTIKYEAGTNTSLITVIGTSIKFESHGLTFDGNSANHDGTTYSIKFNAIGTSTAPSLLSLVGNTFINGDYADVNVFTDTSSSTIDNVEIIRNKFLGGKEGTATQDSRYINIASCVNLNVSDNYFDFLATPTLFGRAGLVSYVSGYTGVGSRGNISGNTFINVGRSSASGNGVLGAIDGYYGVTDMSITGNTLITPWGRGIQIKSNALNVSIVGNNINGLGDLTSGTSVDAQITVNRSTTTGVNGTWLIEGNTCYGSGWDGISVSCANIDLSGDASPVLISGNVITNATRRGIGLVYGTIAQISNNIVKGGCSGAGIYIDTVIGAIGISSNTSSGVTGPDLYVTTPVSAVVSVNDNQFLSSTPYTFNGTDAGFVRFFNNLTASVNAINAYPQVCAVTASDVSWSTGSPNSNVHSVKLSPGIYNIVYEGTVSADAAGGLFLAVSCGTDTLAISSMRTFSQVWTGTTLSVSNIVASTSGSPSQNAISAIGAFTHYRIVTSMTVTTAGTLVLRGNQSASDAIPTIIYQGASQKITRIQ